MNRPWFQFYSRDWLDNKELRRCSPESRSILADLMCLAHEGHDYGYLNDSVGSLTTEYMAARCAVPASKFQKCLAELIKNTRVHQDEKGFFIPRMVSDEDIRTRRAAGGSLGGNPNLKPKSKVNLPPNLNSNLTPATEGYLHSRARTRADYDSGSVCNSSSEFCISSEELETAWERHLKHSRGEPQDLAFRMIHSKNGTFDVGKFRARHEQYCSSWTRAGWQFCPLTFLGWIEAGMPLPPPEPAPKHGGKTAAQLVGLDDDD